MPINLDQAIEVLDRECEAPCLGLPEEVFLLLTRLTPMINVDLLIKDNDGRTLLTWRDDIYHGKGWHIPGGIIRLKETATERIAKVAKLELSCEVNASPKPVAIKEFIAKDQLNRSHCISLLYSCTFKTYPPDSLAYQKGVPKVGMYKFFDRAPENLLKVHYLYRETINQK